MYGVLRSLFDVGNRRSGFIRDEGQSLFDLRFRRSGFVGGEGYDLCLVLRK